MIPQGVFLFRDRGEILFIKKPEKQDILLISGLQVGLNLYDWKTGLEELFAPSSQSSCCVL
jgi:hypothetical protein